MIHLIEEFVFGSCIYIDLYNQMILQTNRTLVAQYWIGMTMSTIRLHDKYLLNARLNLSIW